MARKKKQYVEEQIFTIYSDFPVLINDKVIWTQEEKPLHFHYYLEIGYCFEGRGVICSESCSHEVEKGDITIVAPNMLHSIRSEKDVYTRWGTIYVDLADQLKLFPAGNTKAQLQMIQKSFQNLLCLSGEKYPEISWIIQEIIRLHSTKKQSYKMQIMGLLFALLFNVYDTFSEEKQESNNSKNIPILPAIEYIFDHYMEPIKVGELAKVCHFSESYFRKVFLEMKGIGPMDYVNSIRIREACRMLLNSTDTVRMIGEKCGYPSVTTFERNFRQRTGMLPSQWRESKKKLQKNAVTEYEIKRIYNEDI